MVEIITSGSVFESLVKDANRIVGFTRESYALRFRKENKEMIIIAPSNGIIYPFGDKTLVMEVLEELWYLNLHIGGVIANSELAEVFKNIFEGDYKGKAKRFSTNGDIVTYFFEEVGRKRALFAGGCFWCIAMPYYDTKGVLSVKSGYAGGKELYPSYIEVKNQNTTHKECILVEYNPNEVEYERLLELYFENIDPFDMEGQYIDRGYSYAPAIYTSLREERMRVIEYKYQLSDECERQCLIPLEENVVFFLAEEEHQNYAIKNPKEMEEELIASGRLKK